MTRTTPQPATEPVRDSMREPRGAVAGVLWASTWIAAVMAIAVTGISAVSALQLAGVPDPGPPSIK